MLMQYIKTIPNLCRDALSLLRLLFRSYRLVEVYPNQYSAGHSKLALLSYTTTPYRVKDTLHSNYLEVKSIVAVLNELGYGVHIVDYDSIRSFDYSRYDLIFGFGDPLEKSFSVSCGSLTRICYMTGASSSFQNRSELIRVKAYNKANFQKISAKRVISRTWDQSIAFSDALILLGNEWTLSTYREKETPKERYIINGISLCDSQIISSGQKSQKTFVWFGSTGAIHKGLDLCLQVFKKNRDLTLHVCGSVDEDFGDELLRIQLPENIIIHGYVVASSAKFNSIVAESTFAILPTCSEGQSTSLLTMMAAGIIPVSTVASGLNIADYGITIEDLTEKGVENAVKKAITSNSDDIEKLSDLCEKVVSKFHTENSFRHSLSQILHGVLY